MKRQRAYKTKLDPNNKQTSYLYACAGFARFVFNWGLAEWKRQYEAGEKPNAYALKKQFNAIKDEQFPWVREYPYVIGGEAFDHLRRAFQNFFRRLKAGEKPGFPRFKSRKFHTPAFTLRDVKVEDGRIRLSAKLGWMRLAEPGYLPVNGMKINTATFTERAGQWFVSLQVEYEAPEVEPAQGVPLGLDMGIKSLAVASDGVTFDNPRTLSKYEAKLARLQRELSRRKRGSKNRDKTRQKIAKLHYQIAETRRHTLHNISRHVTYTIKPEVLVIEDLNVKGMMANGKSSKAVADASMGELRRQIEYKAEWNGVEVKVADRWYPSTQTCSACGHRKEGSDKLNLSERVYQCQKCGSEIDRDLNAAKNLAALAK